MLRLGSPPQVILLETDQFTLEEMKVKETLEEDLPTEKPPPRLLMEETPRDTDQVELIKEPLIPLEELTPAPLILLEESTKELVMELEETIKGLPTEPAEITKEPLTEQVEPTNLEDTLPHLVKSPPHHQEETK